MVKKSEYQTTHLGHTLIDDYRWMHDRDSPEVLSYLNAENDNSDAFLKKHKKLHDQILDELKSRVVKNKVTLPFFDNGYYYFRKYLEENEHPIYCRSKSAVKGDPYEVLFDPNVMASREEYFSIGEWDVSPDNTRMAVTIDTKGRRIYNLYCFEIAEDYSLKKVAENVTDNFCWDLEGKGLYVTRQDLQTLRYNKIQWIDLSSGAIKDVFEETDEKFYVSLSRTTQGDSIFLSTESSRTTGIFRLSLTKPFEPELLVPKSPGVECYIDEDEQYYYLLTNHSAENFKVVRSPKAKEYPLNGIEQWQNFVDHNPRRLIENIHAFRHFFAIEYMEEGLGHIELYSDNGQILDTLKFEDEIYCCQLAHNYDFEAKFIRYNYSSLTHPDSYYDYFVDSLSHILREREEFDATYDPKEYCCMRIWVPARDGVKIPVSILYRQNFPPSDERSLLLQGYGSYGINEEPSFRKNILSLVDRGYVFGLAHIRGSSTLGRPWYESGKMLKKMNTFNDFIDCSRYLIDNRYCNEKKLDAIGGSAGGLLMGACLNMAPDLYRSVVAVVPFVDVVNTMLDSSLPLTTFEYEEWGHPDDPEVFKLMLAYSPYENIKKQDYPNIFVPTGYHDSQVQYFEPAKWVAKLREYNTSKNHILLKTNMTAGHSGTSGRWAYLEEVADIYTFLLANAGD